MQSEVGCCALQPDFAVCGSFAARSQPFSEAVIASAQGAIDTLPAQLNN